jgi:hypothetical protein
MLLVLHMAMPEGWLAFCGSYVLWSQCYRIVPHNI